MTPKRRPKAKKRRRVPREGYVPLLEHVPDPAHVTTKDPATGKVVVQYPGYPPYPVGVRFAMPPVPGEQTYGPHAARWAYEFSQRAYRARVKLGWRTRVILRKIRCGEALKYSDWFKLEEYLRGRIAEQERQARPFAVRLGTGGVRLERTQ